MKIQILSDLHFEFYGDGGRRYVRELPVLGDVLVLAGDILKLSSYEIAEMTFKWFCDKFQHVVYVPGNHEYYGSSPETVNSVLQRLSQTYTNLHVLDGSAWELGGQRFLGGTLWFPYLDGEERLRHQMTDFGVISNFVSWVHRTHDRHCQFLEDAVRSDDIVVTHHLPHCRSIAPQYTGSPINRFFYSPVAEKIMEYGPTLWIHGHTHTCFDYYHGYTRIVANPRGYPGEVGTTHRTDLVIEV